MRIPNRCPNCNTRVPVQAWYRETQTFNVGEPWAEKMVLSECRCQHCFCPIHAVLTEHDPDNAIYWNQRCERLFDGGGFKLLRRRYHSGILDGRKPTMAFYAHLPLQEPKYIDAMHARILADANFMKRHCYSILIYPHYWDTSWAMEHNELFDEVWLLDKQVTLGAIGPYPSLRAELSIRYTLRQFDLRHIVHCWPAASLAASDYVALAPPEELQKDWALFNRTRLPIKVG